MKILTIIVSYNFMPWIDKCLGSMIQSGYPTDILVLDNDSKDDTVKTIRERYPQVRLIENHANLGFGKANNIGILLAIKEDYDAVLLLNEDAWLDTNTLERMAKVSLEHPEY
ncbi:MAG: glycosyltransferase, partial [Prevotella sp.]|nr:glycosyltransferase [Prevotella sp.]